MIPLTMIVNPCYTSYDFRRTRLFKAAIDLILRPLKYEQHFIRMRGIRPGTRWA